MSDDIKEFKDFTREEIRALDDDDFGVEKRNEAPFWVWVTKHALTKGIVKKEVVESFDRVHTMVVENDGVYMNFYLDKEWFPTWAEAVAHARIMRTKKIASLKKKLGKVEACTFSDQEPSATTVESVTDTDDNDVLS